MGSKGSWVGDYYRVTNPMQHGFPLYYTPEGSTELFTEMFGSWTGYEGKFAFGWDFLQGIITGGWVTVNPGAFQEHTQVPWAEIPRKKVDETVLSTWGPTVALQENRLSNEITTNVHTTAFSGGFKYDPYCLKPVSGWPGVEVNKHVKSTGQWIDTEGSGHNEAGVTFERNYTNNGGSLLENYVHIEAADGSEGSLPTEDDLRSQGYPTDINATKVGLNTNTYGKITDFPNYSLSNPINGDLPLDKDEFLYDFARGGDTAATTYWIIDEYEASQFADFANGQSQMYNSFIALKQSQIDSGFFGANYAIGVGPDEDPMWTSESWTQEADPTLAQRKQNWISENCTGDDWTSPRPGCDIENQINYITV